MEAAAFAAGVCRLRNCGRSGVRAAFRPGALSPVRLGHDRVRFTTRHRNRPRRFFPAINNFVNHLSMATSSSQADGSLLAVAGMLVRERFTSGMRRLLGLLDRCIGSHSTRRFFAILLVYALELGTVFYIAYALRWDFATPADFRKQRMDLIIPVTLCKLLLLYSFGQFRSILSYFGLTDFGGVTLAMITVSGMMLGLSYESAVTAAPPHGVILMDFVLSVAVISAFRLFLRVARTWSISGQMRS